MRMKTPFCSYRHMLCWLFLVLDGFSKFATRLLLMLKTRWLHGQNLMTCHMMTLSFWRMPQLTIYQMLLRQSRGSMHLSIGFLPLIQPDESFVAKNHLLFEICRRKQKASQWQTLQTLTKWLSKQFQHSSSYLSGDCEGVLYPFIHCLAFLLSVYYLGLVLAIPIHFIGQCAQSLTFIEHTRSVGTLVEKSWLWSLWVSMRPTLFRFEDSLKPAPCSPKNWWIQ